MSKESWVCPLCFKALAKKKTPNGAVKGLFTMHIKWKHKDMYNDNSFRIYKPILMVIEPKYAEPIEKNKMSKKEFMNIVKILDDTNRYSLKCYCSKCCEWFYKEDIDLNYPYCPECGTALRFKARNKKRLKNTKIFIRGDLIG